MIFLDGELLEVLREQKVIRDSNYPDCPWVFFNKGRPIKGFKRAWQTACKKAGLPGKLFHDFRRTAARDMIRAGIPERVAIAITGPKTRSIFDRYNIVSQTDLEEAARKRSQYVKKMTGTILGTIEGAEEFIKSLTS